VPQTTNPLWWTLAQILVWILQQVDLPPQDAEQFCNELKPKTIEETLNALVGALFNALYGAVEGMPMTIARVPCGHGYENLATFFPLPPSLDSGASDALRNELRQFIRQQPDIQFNPTWGRWTWPVCVSAAQAAPTPTRPTESAVADEAEPIPSSKVGSEESQPPNKPNSVDASTQAGPARIINVGYDPAIAHAIHAIKPRRPISPSYEEDMLVAALDAALAAAQTPRPEAEPRSSPSAAPASAASAESPGAEPEPALPSTLAVLKPAQSSVEVPAPVSPSPQEPTPIALLVETALTALALPPPLMTQESVTLEPQQSGETAAALAVSQESLESSDWSIETVFQELGVKGRVQRVIVEALPKIYRDDIAGALDRLVAKKPWPTARLRQAIGALLEAEAGKKLRSGEIPSWDACKDFLTAWCEWRARHP
jgi:hypothetical protein